MRLLLAPRALGAALSQVFSHVAVTVGANLTAILFSIPLLLMVGVISLIGHSYSLIPVGMALALGILPNPAAAGLHVIARDLAHGEMYTLSEQWTGLREYWRPAIVAWFISLAAFLLILLNLIFYAHLAPQMNLLSAVFAVWVMLLLIWLGVHMYFFPLLVQQERKSIWTAYRNALIVALSRPFTTFFLVPFWLAILLFASGTGLVTIIGLGLAAVVQHNALRVLLPSLPKDNSPERANL